MPPYCRPHPLPHSHPRPSTRLSPSRSSCRRYLVGRCPHPGFPRGCRTDRPRRRDLRRARADKSPKAVPTRSRPPRSRCGKGLRHLPVHERAVEGVGYICPPPREKHACGLFELPDGYINHLVYTPRSLKKGKTPEAISENDRGCQDIFSGSCVGVFRVVSIQPVQDTYGNKRECLFGPAWVGLGILCGKGWSLPINSR